MTRFFTRIHFIFLFTILCSSVEAQHPVTVKVLNEKNQVVPFATIRVNNRLDSVETFQKITDSLGIAVFQLKKNEQYQFH